MIRQWDCLDYDDLARRTRLIGFDLDNTLANSRKPMLPDVAARFSELTRHIDVAVITGGRWELVVSLQRQPASHAHQRHPLLPLGARRLEARVQP